MNTPSKQVVGLERYGLDQYIFEKTVHFSQKGKINPVLSEYLHAWHEDLNNDSIVYTIAELYKGLDSKKEALECYSYMLDKSIERADIHKDH